MGYQGLGPIFLGTVLLCLQGLHGQDFPEPPFPRLKLILFPHLLQVLVMSGETHWEQWKKWGLWTAVCNLELSHQAWVGLQSGQPRSPAYPVCLTTHLATGRA